MMKIVSYDLKSSLEDVQKIKYEKKYSKNRKGFTWMIASAEISKLEKTKNFESMIFDQESPTIWYLDIHALDDYFSIYLCLKSPEKALAKFEISILRNDDTAFTRSVSTYLEIKQGLGWKHFIKKNELLKEEYGYITITCLLKIFAGTEQELAEKSTNLKGLAASFGKLLEDPKYSDVNFVIGDKTFKSHRSILAAQCNKFKTMFNGANNNDITLKDIEADVFQEVLVYLYTNKVPKLKEMADKLLKAAHQFEIENLVIICDIQLAHNLTVETVAPVLELASSCSRFDLVAFVEKFIKENYEAVSANDSWIELKEKQPSLVIDALEAVTNDG